MVHPSKSYVQGGAAGPLLGLTVGAVLDAAASQWPDREALVVPDQDVRWTWFELRERSKSLAAGLLEIGLEPGDRIGMLAPNVSEWLVVQFATAYAGLILVNINPAYRLPELEYALNKVGCRAMISATGFKSSDYNGMFWELITDIDSATPGQLDSKRVPELRSLIFIGTETGGGYFGFDDVCALGKNTRRLDEISARLDFDDPINIQFTSGTTGSPKAATLTHHNIVNNAFIASGILRFTDADRLCIPLPMYHCFGMVLGTLLCATAGAAIVFPSAGFNATRTLEILEAEKCTAFHGVPTMFIALLDDPGFHDFDLTSLRTGIMAGAPCPIELMRQVISDMHMTDITIGYGMTETGPLSTLTSPDDPVELRVATVGRPLPHTEIKVIDENGSILPVGERGELCTRGYCVMRGYWEDTERTAEVIDESGWIKTGDLATMNEDGYLRIVGRIKDMLIRGGENIFPREIEELLYTHPKIDEVEVFGVPDRKFGEEVAAWIRLGDGESASDDEIREFCKGKLAHFKIPRYIKFVDEFPLTVTGKVQKFVMREQMAGELGLDF